MKALVYQGSGQKTVEERPLLFMVSMGDGIPLMGLKQNMFCRV